MIDKISLPVSVLAFPIPLEITLAISNNAQPKEGYTPAPTMRISDVDKDILAALADQFKENLLAAAGYTEPDNGHTERDGLSYLNKKIGEE